MNAARERPRTLTAVYGKNGDRYLELIRRFPLRHITTEAELDAAIRMVDELVDIETRTPPEDDYLVVLSDLIYAYEEKRYPEEPISDAAMLQFLIESRGATQTEAAKGAGIAASTVSEVLSGKRRLNRTQIGKLARYFKVDPGVFAFPG